MKIEIEQNISTKEIINVIEILSIKKANGPDGI